MSKLCVTCNTSIDNLTNNLFSQDDDNIIPNWFKEIGYYSLLPPPLNNNSKYNLYKEKNKKTRYPKDYDTKLETNINKQLPNINGEWVFYWASKKRNYNKTSYCEPADSYGDFSNCGLAKIDKLGYITFKFNNPRPYQYENIRYPPHLHFVFLEKNNLPFSHKYALLYF